MVLRCSSFSFLLIFIGVEKKEKNCVIIKIYNGRCYFFLQLIPPNKTKQQLPSVPNDLSPSVGVSVVLRKEDQVRELNTFVQGICAKMEEKENNSVFITIC